MVGAAFEKRKKQEAFRSSHSKAPNVRGWCRGFVFVVKRGRWGGSWLQAREGATVGSGLTAQGKAREKKTWLMQRRKQGRERGDEANKRNESTKKEE